MARPRSLHGVNKVCAQCDGLCKQSSGLEVLECPLFRATGADPAKLGKPLREARRTRYVPNRPSTPARYRRGA